MIIMTTVFKIKEGQSAEVSQHLLDGIFRELVDTGKMPFYYGPFRYIGPEINGMQWDVAVTYGLRDMDAFRDWCFLPEHIAIDHEYTSNGVIEAAFGFQLTDDLNPDLPNEMAAVFREMNGDRSRWGEGADIPAIRLGAAYATRPEGV